MPVTASKPNSVAKVRPLSPAAEGSWLAARTSASISAALEMEGRWRR
jgi:hypothetical protein